MTRRITNYTEDEMIPLSGIQHFLFCSRQWGLIHLEQQWQDNILTVEGTLLHDRVDDPEVRKSGRGHVLTLRGLHVASAILGLQGIADAVEIHPAKDIKGDLKNILSNGKSTMIPIEYKRGRSKINDCDRVQVAAQAMALEEMFQTDISRGAVFYWEQRQREYIEIDQSLRDLTTDISMEMHNIYTSGITPKPIRSKSCRSCSLAEICMAGGVENDEEKYLMTMLNEEIT